MAAFLVFVAGLATLALAGKLDLDPVAISAGANWIMIALVVGYFGYLLLFAGLDRAERSRAWRSSDKY